MGRNIHYDFLFLLMEPVSLLLDYIILTLCVYVIMFGCLSILWRNFYPHSNIGLLILYIFVHILHRFHFPLCRVKIKTAEKKLELFLPTISWDSVPKLGSYLKLSNCTVFFLIVIISKTDSTYKKTENKANLLQLVSVFPWNTIDTHLSIFGFKYIFRLFILGSRLLALWSVFSCIVSHLQKSLLLPFPLQKKV